MNQNKGYDSKFSILVMQLYSSSSSESFFYMILSIKRKALQQRRIEFKKMNSTIAG